MVFEVYPMPQTAPLVVPASGSSPLVSITERIAADPTTGLDTMFIRLVKLGAGCAPSGPPHPTIRLAAGDGDPVPLTIGATVPIFDGPGGTGAEVANATLGVEDHDVYRIRVFVFVFQPGNTWQLQIVNHDPDDAHGFTWVVADNDSQTRQPWIDLPATLTYNALAGQTVTRGVQVANHGTGPLTITDSTGPLGAGFALTRVPGAVDPNACADVEITFTAPATHGVSAAVYTVTSNDTTAQHTIGHSRRVTLEATTRGPDDIRVPNLVGLQEADLLRARVCLSLSFATGTPVTKETLEQCLLRPTKLQTDPPGEGHYSRAVDFEFMEFIHAEFRGRIRFIRPEAVGGHIRSVITAHSPPAGSIVQPGQQITIEYNIDPVVDTGIRL